MHRAARILGVVTSAFLAGCSSPSSSGTAAGYDGGSSSGTATLSGAVTGTLPVIAFGSVDTSSDCGSYWRLVVGANQPPPESRVSCSLYLPGSSLVEGSFTPPTLDGSFLQCSLVTGVGSSLQDWELVTDFVLNITSSGPGYPQGLSVTTLFPYPSGSLTFTLAPYPQYTYGNVSVNVSFGPPPN
jgi:hypothetical protein